LIFAQLKEKHIHAVANLILAVARWRQRLYPKQFQLKIINRKAFINRKYNETVIGA
jgi:hypothetical protein